MDSAALHATIESERRALADVLDTLEPAQFATPSLCAGWTLQDVLAHLTLTSRLSRIEAVKAVLLAGFDINKMIDSAARARAARFTPAELVAQYHETVASDRRPLGTSEADPLVDVLVHAQDISRPLGIPHTMPAEHVVPALDQVLGSSFYGTRQRLEGLRLVASDADWSAGDGDHELSGPAGELLLAATGRPAGLAALDGPGVADLAARL